MTIHFVFTWKYDGTKATQAFIEGDTNGAAAASRAAYETATLDASVKVAALYRDAKPDRMSEKGPAAP